MIHKVGKASGKALAEQLENLIKEGEEKGKEYAGFGADSFFKGYVQSGLKHIIEQLKTGAFLS